MRIKPWVTLFHWDYPQALFCRGGWLNSDSSDWFAEYAQVVVDKLSDRVTHWFTLNEPSCFIQMGHYDGVHAPGIKLPWREVNIAWHNELLAHGKAVQVIRARSIQKAMVGAAPTFSTVIPYSDQPDDIEAARKQFFTMREPTCWSATWWLDPALRGVYPADGIKVHGENAPKVKPGDMRIIKQPLDFLGFNCYFSETVRADKNGDLKKVPYPTDYPHSDLEWPLTPTSLHYAVKFLYDRYKLPIVITENGIGLADWVSVDGKVHDPARIDYLTRYLRGYKKAAEDGVKLLGYFYWSATDNFEWAAGQHKRFGLVHVDYPTQKRTIKDSAYWYKDVIASNGENLGDNPIENWPLSQAYGTNIKDFK